MDLLIITPWKEEWLKNDVYSYPEVFYLKPLLKKSVEYGVISPNERPKYDKYKTIWCQSEIPYPYAKELVKRLKPKKFIVSIYGIFERFPLRTINKILYPIHLYRYRKLDEAFKGGADIFLIIDDGSKGEELAKMYNVNYVMLLNPKPQYPKIDKAEARELLKLPKDDVIGAFIGRFSKFKGIHFLPKIYRKNDPYRLIIVGNGKMKPEERWIKEINSIIIEQIPHTKMNIVYSAVDFVIMPYIYGNLTAVMVESLFYGLPTVSFKAHSTDRIIINGHNGFYAENFNLKEFREFCITLAKDESLRAYMGENAKKSSEKFPTWEENTSKILKYLTE
ncbi:MAG: glycosyltransferase [candidate division WOR-3 bacterium]